MNQPTYQEILNGVIQITSKYTIGIIVRGIPVDLINSSLRANLEKVKAANSYENAERLINDVLASVGAGSLSEHITDQQDCENVYKLGYLWRSKLLAESDVQAPDHVVPNKV